MSNSIDRPSGGKARKPKKPPSDFELKKHKGTGYWCKKVLGKVYYFGKVADDPKGIAALEEWLRVKDDRKAGREPPAIDPDAMTVARLCDHFYDHHKQRRDDGEISPRTLQTYYATCETLVKVFGRGAVPMNLTPADFGNLRKKLAKTRGAVAMRNEIQRVRCIFKHAFANDLIPRPVKFGSMFEKPRTETVDRAREEHRQEHGDRMFEAVEIRRILATAKQPLRAMVLLAANTGFGQSDLSSLPTRVVNLDTGWVDFARVKTAVRRKCWLWPETIAAIREWLPMRPKAKDPADSKLLFLTYRGHRWVKLTKSGAPCDALGQEFSKILYQLGLKRRRVGFYALRHGFETIAGETTDQVAVDAVMGHKPKGMRAHYIERVGDDRLRRVAEHVRAWLFAEAPDDDQVHPDDGDVPHPDDAGLPTTGDDVSCKDDAPRLRIVG